jgi:hypothetical protein
MNEEYLWSKKGSDPEIEKLEGLLSRYRLEPISASVFVPQIAEAQERSVAKRFGWFVGIASPSFALTLFAFWFFSTSPSGTLQVRSFANNDQIGILRSGPMDSSPVKVSEKEVSTSSPAALPKPKATLVKTVYRSRRPKTDRSQTLTAQTLTREEKYAYDRLMLALSITGTKLKVVQDTIDRSGDLEKRSIRNDK